MQIKENDIYTLKELRAKYDKTQEEVARDLGVSTQTYCAWEKDISNVAVSKVQAVANYYGVRLTQIFFTSPLENNSSNLIA